MIRDLNGYSQGSFSARARRIISLFGEGNHPKFRLEVQGQWLNPFDPGNPEPLFKIMLCAIEEMRGDYSVNFEPCSEEMEDFISQFYGIKTFRALARTKAELFHNGSWMPLDERTNFGIHSFYELFWPWVEGTITRFWEKREELPDE